MANRTIRLRMIPSAFTINFSMFSFRKERGQAHLPDRELITVELVVLNRKGFQLESTERPKVSCVGKVGLPPVPNCPDDFRSKFPISSYQSQTSSLTIAHTSRRQIAPAWPSTTRPVSLSPDD